MFRSGAGRPPFRATHLASTPTSARAAALPSSGVPHGAGGCTASATESAILKEIRDMKRQQQQGMEKILDEIRELEARTETDAREDLPDKRN